MAEKKKPGKPASQDGTRDQGAVPFDFYNQKDWEDTPPSTKEKLSRHGVEIFKNLTSFFKSVSENRLIYLCMTAGFLFAFYHLPSSVKNAEFASAFLFLFFAMFMVRTSQKDE